MIKKNKIVSLTVIGIVLGGIVGTLVSSGQINTVTGAVFGGVVGFLAGWIWNSRSDGSTE
mgnify:CR=1 FL=1